MKYDKNIGTVHEDSFTFLITSRSVLVRMRNISDKLRRGNQNKPFRFKNFFSIICLTTDPIHQSHEKRKEIREVSTCTAQHVRAATQSIKCKRQSRHVALANAGPMVVTNNMAASKHNMLSLLHVACLKLLFKSRLFNIRRRNVV